ncbi:hypothetical protein GCM10010532_042860 [Dactylosporangium siamense]|uniref:Uncharacterized protein n=1 Tax=Dactylosporangium siamense TaxID=685454 RepID=A0A919U7Y0_9ACTN|nr:hypothetical protein Dsi01nite_031430 [Dactylosporangium siamense]
MQDARAGGGHHQLGHEAARGRADEEPDRPGEPTAYAAASAFIEPWLADRFELATTVPAGP